MIKLTTRQIKQLAEFSVLFASLDPELANRTYYISEITNGVIAWSEDAPELKLLYWRNDVKQTSIISNCWI